MPDTEGAWFAVKLPCTDMVLLMGSYMTMLQDWVNDPAPMDHDPATPEGRLAAREFLLGELERALRARADDLDWAVAKLTASNDRVKELLCMIDNQNALLEETPLKAKRRWFFWRG